jgi:hypothetical protein
MLKDILIGLWVNLKRTFTKIDANAVLRTKLPSKKTYII